MKTITKERLASLIISSPSWDGNMDPRWLMKNYTMSQLRDLYDQCQCADDDLIDEMEKRI